MQATPTSFHIRWIRLLPVLLLAAMTGIVLWSQLALAQDSDAPPQLDPVLAAVAESNPPAVQQYYIPLPEQDIFNALNSLNDEVTSPIHGFISIVAGKNAGSGLVQLYYDHWEDGYEIDLSNPTQATTEVWGDGDPANGAPPGYPGDVLASGSVIVLENDVPLPRDTSVIFYDGGDTLGSTVPIAMTRGGWPLNPPGTKLAGAVEVVDTARYGQRFVAPVGEDTPSNAMFEFVQLAIMAQEDNTSVSVDVNGDGSADTVAVLAQGETLIVDDVLAGAEVTTSEPVQVDLLTGDIDAEYEARWYTLVPETGWSDSYFTPVGTTNAADGPVDVYIYNHNDETISVQWENALGAQPAITVAPGSTAQRTLPDESGHHFFTNNGKSFTVLSTIDSDPVENEIFDWGLTLLSDDLLSPAALVGWGVSNFDTACTDAGDVHPPASPVWVTAVADANLYIDYDGDPSTGDNIDPNGNRYDQLESIGRLEALTIFDPNDFDQTGMLVYALDSADTTRGVDIIVAWGQDPARGQFGSLCNLDLGTLILPLPGFTAAKSAVLVTDNDGDGSADVGDVIGYLVTIQQVGPVIVPDVILSDTLPNYVEYVPNTTVKYTPDAAPVPDNDPPASAFPLDEGGIIMGDLPVGGVFSATFQVTITGPFPANVDTIINQAHVTAIGEEVNPDVETPVDAAPDLAIIKDDGGVGFLPGDTIVYTLNYSNIGAQDALNAVISDTVPAYTMFDPSNSTPGWTCAPDSSAGSVCTLAVGDLAVGESGSATFAVVVDDVAPVDEICNVASIGDDGSQGEDLDPSNNFDEECTPRPQFDVDKAYEIVTDLDGDGRVDNGDSIGFIITVRNTGEVIVPDVVISDTFDTFHMRYEANSTVLYNPDAVSIPDDAPPRTPFPLDEGGVAVGDIPVGGELVVEFVVTVHECFIDELTNTVVVTVGDMEEDDTVTVPLDTPPDMVLIKTDDDIGTVMAGDTLVYRLVYLNTGQNDATGVVLTEQVPTYTAFNAEASDEGWSCSAENDVTTCTLDIGDVPTGGLPQEVTFAVTVQSVPVSVTQLENVARIDDDGSQGPDPTPGNNHDEVLTPVISDDTGELENPVYVPIVLR